jgi:hypothetical protein
MTHHGVAQVGVTGKASLGLWRVAVHLHSACVGCRLACRMHCVLDSYALCAAALVMMLTTVVGAAGLDPPPTHQGGTSACVRSCVCDAASCCWALMHAGNQPQCQLHHP